MVDLKKLSENPEATITKVIEQPLRKYLGDKTENWKKAVKKFPKNVDTPELEEEYLESRLDSNVLVIFYNIGDNKTERSEYFTIPNTQVGYQQSNLRKIVQINTLPDKSENWVNCRLKLMKDGDYFRIMK